MAQQTIAPYYGGKASHAKRILPILNAIPHRTYVEPFGGMAGLLLQKAPAKVEVYNDTDQALVTLFRIMRDDPESLQNAIALTPYARDEYHDCLARLRSGECKDLELARVTYCLLYMSFSSSLAHAGYSHQGPGYTGNNAKNMHRTDYFQSVSKRLAGVLKENAGYEKVIRQWLHVDTLFYLDPPYCTLSERNSVGYRDEWKEENHKSLADLLVRTEGLFVLSGYDTIAYTPLIKAGWKRESYSAAVMQSGAKARPIKTECLWISPAAQAASKNLFSL